MVNFQTNPPVGGQGFIPQGWGSGSSILWDTITAAGVSVFSLIMAESVQRKSPDLAIALRLVPMGAGLVWLLRRCLGGNQQGFHQQQSVVAPVHRGWSRWIPQMNWLANSMPPQQVYHHHHAPQPATYFPTVQHVPANPTTVNLPPPAYHMPAHPTVILQQAPQGRGFQSQQPFPTVLKTPANSPAVAYTLPPAAPAPQMTRPVGPAPASYQSAQQPFPTVLKTPANSPAVGYKLPPVAPAPQMTRPAAPTSSFPSVQTGSAALSSFPAVQRASPQPGWGMQQAPANRMVQAPTTRV